LIYFKFESKIVGTFHANDGNIIALFSYSISILA